MTVSSPSEAMAEDAAERVERRWAAVSASIMALLVFLAAFAGVHQASAGTIVDPGDPDVNWTFTGVPVPH